jgi:hypothetical protein
MVRRPIAVVLVCACGSSQRATVATEPTHESSSEENDNAVSPELAKCRALPVESAISPSPSAAAPASGEPTLDETFESLKANLSSSLRMHDPGGVTWQIEQSALSLGDCAITVRTETQTIIDARKDAANEPHCEVTQIALRAVDLKGLHVGKFSAEIAESGKGEFDQDGWVVGDHSKLFLSFDKEDIATRVSEAIKHAAELCSANKS